MTFDNLKKTGLIQLLTFWNSKTWAIIQHICFNRASFLSSSLVNPVITSVYQLFEIILFKFEPCMMNCTTNVFNHVSLCGQATSITKTITNLFILLCHYRMRLADWLNEGRCGSTQWNRSIRLRKHRPRMPIPYHRLHES